LARVNIARPRLPLEVRASRLRWWLDLPILAAFLALPLFTLATRGAVRPFWLSSALFIYLSVSTVRAYRTAPRRVLIDAGHLTIWSSGRHDQYQLASIRSVGLALSRNWAIIPYRGDHRRPLGGHPYIWQSQRFPHLCRVSDEPKAIDRGRPTKACSGRRPRFARTSQLNTGTLARAERPAPGASFGWIEAIPLVILLV
jgi:hypothetical protein